jgi:hypothetical protein
MDHVKSSILSEIRRLEVVQHFRAHHKMSGASAKTAFIVGIKYANFIDCFTRLSRIGNFWNVHIEMGGVFSSNEKKTSKSEEEAEKSGHSHSHSFSPFSLLTTAKDRGRVKFNSKSAFIVFALNEFTAVHCVPYDIVKYIMITLRNIVDLRVCLLA